MLRLITALFVLSSLLLDITVFATPAQVLIIRHAEKPSDETNIGLSQKGFLRAQELVPYFKTNPAVTEYGTPTAIYAMKQRSKHSSIRAIQTVKPLAYALDLEIKMPHTRDEVAPLVHEIMNHPRYQGKMVLICWEHDAIVDMVEEFGLKKKIKWDSDDYESVIKLDFKGDQLRSMTRLKQNIKTAY